MINWILVRTIPVSAYRLVTDNTSSNSTNWSRIMFWIVGAILLMMCMRKVKETFWVSRDMVHILPAKHPVLMTYPSDLHQPQQMEPVLQDEGARFYPTITLPNNRGQLIGDEQGGSSSESSSEAVRTQREHVVFDPDQASEAVRTQREHVVFDPDHKQFDQDDLYLMDFPTAYQKEGDKTGNKRVICVPQPKHPLMRDPRQYDSRPDYQCFEVDE